MLRPVSNPPNPWSTVEIDWLGDPPPAALEIYEEEAKSLIVENDSGDVSFRFGVNPYRGCQHGCAYCYARPSHQYLGFGAGTDFDRKIVVKVNAPELLKRELSRKSWVGDEIVFSGNTDCYQPLEASYRLTRRCLEVCRDFRNPVSIITKGILLRRDLDVLVALARVARLRVHVSIPFLDPEVSRALEPGPAAPVRRLEMVKALTDAGIEVGVSLAPLIPGLNDREIPEILTRAREAGATSAFFTMLRLPAEVLPVFRERLEAALPLHAARVLSAIRDCRGGRMNEPALHKRMVGQGPRWDLAERLFRVTATRLGLNLADPPAGPEVRTFRRPPDQPLLFET